MVTIQDLIAAGKGAGIFDFFLPFIMTFAVIYGIILKTKIFGEPTVQPAKTISVIISISVAAFVMLATPVGTTFTQFFATFFSETLITVLSLVGFMIVMYVGMNILQPGATWNWSKYAWLILIGAAILGIGMFVSSGGTAFFPGLPELGLKFNLPGISAQTWAVLVVAILLIAVVVFFMR